MAPFTPFLTEHIYQNLRRCHGAASSDKSDSVHFCDVPAATQESQADTHIQQVTSDCSAWNMCCSCEPCDLVLGVMPKSRAVEQACALLVQSVQRMQQVIELGRGIRDQAKRPLKVPLRSLVVVHTDQTFLQDIAGDYS